MVNLSNRLSGKVRSTCLLAARKVILCNTGLLCLDEENGWASMQGLFLGQGKASLTLDWAASETTVSCFNFSCCWQLRAC